MPFYMFLSMNACFRFKRTDPVVDENMRDWWLSAYTRHPCTIVIHETTKVIGNFRIKSSVKKDTKVQTGEKAHITHHITMYYSILVNKLKIYDVTHTNICP